MRRDVEIRAGDVMLRGWLHLPDDGDGPFPAVVATHGWACVKEQGLDVLGETLAAHGVAALVYDHRNTGASDAPLPGHLDPWEQVHDCRHALTHLGTLPDVDSRRLGLWGTSFSAGHVAVLGATDPRVRAVATLVPRFAPKTSLRLLHAMNDPVAALLDEESARWAAGAAPSRIAIVAPDATTPHAAPGAHVHRFFTSWGDRAPAWRNEVTVRSVLLQLEYDARPFLAKLGPTPSLLVVAEDDITSLPQVALDAYASVSGPKEIEVIPGDHYTAYGEYMPHVAHLTGDFFARTLAREVPADDSRGVAPPDVRSGTVPA